MSRKIISLDKKMREDTQAQTGNNPQAGQQTSTNTEMSSEMGIDASKGENGNGSGSSEAKAAQSSQANTATASEKGAGEKNSTKGAKIRREIQNPADKGVTGEKRKEANQSQTADRGSAGEGRQPGSQSQKDSIPVQQRSLTKSLEENIRLMEQIFHHDDSIIYRRLQNKSLDRLKCCIIFIDGMIDNHHVIHSVIEPLLQQDLRDLQQEKDLLEDIQHKVIEAYHVEQTGDLNKILQALCYGDVIFFLDGFDRALIIESKGWETRSITEPQSGKVLRGPRDGFTEDMITNITLLRRRIKNTSLKFRFMHIGKQTHTLICISYIEGLALDSVLVELQQRLNRIDIDGVFDSGYIQELIRDEPLSPFQTVGYSERPDKTAANMLEGRIAIIVDGSPFVLTVPYIAVETIQFNEDYYNHFLFGSFNRFLRSVAAIVTVSIPAVFLAVVTYHQEMLPTQLLISIFSSLEGVPLPTSISLFLMLIVFDVLREAGTRMPESIGQAVNIVGTLVLGQAAVEARLVSAPVVIITAVSGITTLMLPTLIDALILTRLFLLFWASMLGIYGYVFGILIVLLHLMSIRSFGVPYMMTTTRMTKNQGKDCWIRAPWWSMILRPKIIAYRNRRRQISNHDRRDTGG